MKISSLAPNPKNPRTITPAKLEMLKNALREFGDLSGIVFNRKSSTLIGGHQRGKVMSEANIVIEKKYSRPTRTGTVAEGFAFWNEERFNYREVSWDKNKEKAANLAANKGAGDWDLPQVGAWLKELGSFDVNFDIKLTMFDEKEQKQFATTTVSQHERQLPGNEDIDDEVAEPEPIEEPEKLLGAIQLFNDDCLAVMKLIPPNSIDSVVTDPPAGISFMGKAWDGNKGGSKQWIAWMEEVMTQCLRVMKPGAHAFFWAIPRTSHWTATALENAGFEIRDVVTHIFGSGFPKSLDISKAIDKAANVERPVISKHRVQDMRGNKYNAGLPSMDYEVTAPATAAAAVWDGWGTALKPASEHWILVRKPLSEKTVAANVLKWGTGGINIDACRIGAGAKSFEDNRESKNNDVYGKFSPVDFDGTKGRFPANLTLDEEAAALLDEQSGEMGGGKFVGPNARVRNNGLGLGSAGIKTGSSSSPDNYGDTGGASRFFYVAKASKNERNMHCRELPRPNGTVRAIGGAQHVAGVKQQHNFHPTVKSIRLMAYLIRMVTPPNGIVLDCFMGSGSTGVAALNGNFKFVGIEKEKDYFVIASKRLNRAVNETAVVISKSVIRRRDASK